METPINQFKSKALKFYQHHEVLASILFFLFGFILDLLTLGRIDDLLNLIQQAIYLGVLGFLILCEIKDRNHTLIVPKKLEKIWPYHNLIIHFLFGSLLSAYTIFYYTSASALTSFIFILLLAGLMLANEVPRIQNLGLPVRVILYNICILSYFAFFYPILIGHVGILPFWLGIMSSVIVFMLIWHFFLREKVTDSLLLKQAALPTIGVHLFFLLGYYFSLIPPVPVAVKKIGIYYEIEKREGNYIGKHLKEDWKFWQKGSQEFYARTGDKVSVLLSVFSPARFNDEVFLKWYRFDLKNGWRLEDTIPLKILGGRDEGFRGFGTKRFYDFGEWKILVETSDGREVGRISFEIQEDRTAHERLFKEDVF